MVDYYRALAAILLMEVQQTAPSHEYEPEPDSATTGAEGRGDACTSRKRVEQYQLEEGMDYFGRSHRDIYITGPKLADILGCSNETARRRLKYFESQGIVYSTSEGRSKHYEVDEKYSAVDDETVRSIGQIIDAAKETLNAAEEN